MNSFEALQRWWRCAVICDASLRLTFYQVMAAQIRGGASLLSACSSLASQRRLNTTLRKLAKAGAAALGEGRLGSEGFRGSGYLPLEACGAIGVAERTGSLLRTFQSLADPTSAPPTFITAVIRPNGAQLLPFAIALAMTLAAPEVLGRMAGDPTLLRGVPLYAIATWLHAYGVLLAVLCCLAVAVIAYGRSHWYGPPRTLLGVLGRDWFAQMTIRYCRLASLLTREGATHRETLAAFRQTTRNGYVQRVAQLAERDLLDGRSYVASLTGRLLTDELAALFEAFSPGDDRARYPVAFDSLAAIQHSLLVGTYTIWARGLKLLLMVGSAGLIVLLIHGLLDTARNLTQQIGMGF